MKKLICLLLLMFCAFFAFSTEVKNEVICEKTFDFTPSIKVARLWVSESFTSGKNVEDFYDEELKVITGNGTIVEEHEFRVPYNFKFKISIKGNTVKVLFNNMTAGTRKMAITETHSYLDEFYNDLEKLADSLFIYYEDF